jgi:hypothetical protein
VCLVATAAAILASIVKIFPALAYLP